MPPFSPSQRPSLGKQFHKSSDPLIRPVVNGRKFHVLWVLVLFLIIPSSHAEPSTSPASIEAEGRAPADASNPRAEALTDALREAVRIGVGVNVVDQSQSKNGQLDFDRIFVSSLGHVRNYKIVSTALGADGIYRVKILAEVAAGVPEDDDRLTLKMLSHSRQSPRLLIQLTEIVDGKEDSKTGTEYFTKLASEVGISVVSSGPAGGDANARRAAILKRETEADLRGQDLVSSYDYRLEGKVTASSGELKEVYGTKRRMCSVDIGVQVIDNATRRVVVSETLAARQFALEGSLSPDIACREAIRRALVESPDKSKQQPGVRPIRSLFRHWVTEMDLGSVFKVEFTDLALADAEKIRDALAGRDKIGAIWVRSIDPAGVSVIDVESRLDPLELAKSLREASENTYQLDRSENRYLSLRRNSAPEKTYATSKDVSASPTKSPYLYAALAGLLPVALLAKHFFKSAKS
jgi:hypothetical protein